MPISKADLRDLFEFLDRTLFEQRGDKPWCYCDHKLRRSRDFLRSRSLPVETIVDWFGEYGGCCDCEIAANAQIIGRRMWDIEWANLGHPSGRAASPGNRTEFARESCSRPGFAFPTPRRYSGTTNRCRQREVANEHEGEHCERCCVPYTCGRFLCVGGSATPSGRSFLPHVSEFRVPLALRVIFVSQRRWVRLLCTKRNRDISTDVSSMGPRPASLGADWSRDRCDGVGDRMDALPGGKTQPLMKPNQTRAADRGLRSPPPPRYRCLKFSPCFASRGSEATDELFTFGIT
jgi:hypothetical protein